MDISGNSILITGGGTGIGFALAEKFVEAGSEVAICGRRKSRLAAAKQKLPTLHVKQCDISIDRERKKLLRWTIKELPSLNILINNAGIQRSVDFTSPRVAKTPSFKNDEVSINLGGTIRLCGLFTPRLMKRKRAAIVNISSGLAFVPIAATLVYCSTKAAIHSFTTSLRHQLRDTSVRVFEAAPPQTDTELDRSFAGEHEREYRGISADEVATAIIQGLESDQEEIIIGEAKNLYEGAMHDPKGTFKQLNSW